MLVYNMDRCRAVGDHTHVEGTVKLKELLDNPGTAAFSRLKYLQRYGYDDQVKEFINELFLAAAESRYRGDWQQLIDFLDHWDEVATDLQFQSMQMPEAAAIPWAPLQKSLAQSTIALVTTGGVFVEGQTPYTERGDATYREIPTSTPKDKLRIWHPGYDNGPASEDINCIFPLDRFAELEAEGVIGKLAETSYSFMGLIPDPNELVSRTAPEAARRLREAGVDAVFLAST